MDDQTQTLPTPPVPTSRSTDLSPRPQASDELLDDELLVEEISIDGMCGVY